MCPVVSRVAPTLARGPVRGAGLAPPRPATRALDSLLLSLRHRPATEGAEPGPVATALAAIGPGLFRILQDPGGTPPLTPAATPPAPAVSSAGAAGSGPPTATPDPSDAAVEDEKLSAAAAREGLASFEPVDPKFAERRQRLQEKRRRREEQQQQQQTQQEHQHPPQSQQQQQQQRAQQQREPAQPQPEGSDGPEPAERRAVAEHKATEDGMMEPLQQGPPQAPQPGKETQEQAPGPAGRGAPAPAAGKGTHDAARAPAGPRPERPGQQRAEVNRQQPPRAPAAAPVRPSPAGRPAGKQSPPQKQPPAERGASQPAVGGQRQGQAAAVAAENSNAVSAAAQTEPVSAAAAETETTAPAAEVAEGALAAREGDAAAAAATETEAAAAVAGETEAAAAAADEGDDAAAGETVSGMGASERGLREQFDQRVPRAGAAPRHASREQQHPPEQLHGEIDQGRHGSRLGVRSAASPSATRERIKSALAAVQPWVDEMYGPRKQQPAGEPAEEQSAAAPLALFWGATQSGWEVEKPQPQAQSRPQPHHPHQPHHTHQPEQSRRPQPQPQPHQHQQQQPQQQQHHQPQQQQRTGEQPAVKGKPPAAAGESAGAAGGAQGWTLQRKGPQPRQPPQLRRPEQQGRKAEAQEEAAEPPGLEAVLAAAARAASGAARTQGGGVGAAAPRSAPPEGRRPATPPEEWHSATPSGSELQQLEMLLDASAARISERYDANAGGLAAPALLFQSWEEEVPQSAGSAPEAVARRAAPARARRRRVPALVLALARCSREGQRAAAAARRAAGMEPERAKARRKRLRRRKAASRQGLLRVTRRFLRLLPKPDKRVIFTAAELTPESRERFIDAVRRAGILKEVVADAWTFIAHHMTICLGGVWKPVWNIDYAPANRSENIRVLSRIAGIVPGSQRTLRVLRLGRSKDAIAVEVSGCPTVNARAHITIATAPGGQAGLSNLISDWRTPPPELDGLELHTVVKEYQKRWHPDMRTPDL
eukprot:TRINITY_DN20443_c2_g2_i1.p1 TRINITY_DN20443_c2_g2~~TRINITY_DN20443_c2_g2_i1.p1  ORF type:complete len:996 (+),score=242.05 TRINITY_DN20443_c2_g2_i1:117-3104(+)